MIEIHFNPSNYNYYVYKLLTDQHGRVTHYVVDDEVHEVVPGVGSHPYMILDGQMYDELKHHFLTEHEQPLEAKQAVIDELRDVVRVERIRVDQLLQKAMETII